MKIKMMRFYLVTLSSVPFCIRMLYRSEKYCRHPEKYNELERYRLAQWIMEFFRKRGRATTIATGLENLPKEGGYILYSNHQGKYDALGILLQHDEPCRILMEKKQSLKIVAKQVIDLVYGKRLDFEDPRAQLKVLKEISEEVSEGKKYLIFPEGAWGDNKNTLQKFNAGCFRCSIDSQTPIVPVTIIDSYKALNGNSLKPCVTYVHFLPAIPYSEYKGMKKTEISDMVKQRIQDKLDLELGKRA